MSYSYNIFSRLALVSANLPRGARVSAWIEEPPPEWKKYGCNFDLQVECLNPGPSKKDSGGGIDAEIDPLVESVFKAFHDVGAVNYMSPKNNESVKKVTVFL